MNMIPTAHPTMCPVMFIVPFSFFFAFFKTVSSSFFALGTTSVFGSVTGEAT